MLAQRMPPTARCDVDVHLCRIDRSCRSLAAFAEPHSYDLCESHARGSDRAEGLGPGPARRRYGPPPPSNDDLVALAEAVREAARPAPHREDPGNHPHQLGRRGHLRVIPPDASKGSRPRDRNPSQTSDLLGSASFELATLPFREPTPNPEALVVPSAYSRQSARTSQREQMRLASRVDPPFSGKNASGSVCEHKARSCHSGALPSRSATTGRPSISVPPSCAPAAMPAQPPTRKAHVLQGCCSSARCSLCPKDAQLSVIPVEHPP